MIEPRNKKEEKDLWQCFKEGAAAAGRPPCPDENDLGAYLDGRASKKQARAIEEHLASCAACLEALRELHALLRGPLINVPSEVKERARSTTRPRHPEKERVTTDSMKWLDALHPYIQTSVGWAAAAVIIVAACTAGITLGRGTFQNRREIVSSARSEIVFDVGGSIQSYLGPEDFVKGGI